MATSAAPRTYPVRTKSAQYVQQALLNEQADRQKGGNRLSLMAITAEWLEEKAREKLAIIEQAV